MKKALVFFFAVVIGLSFAFTGFAQESTTPGPAKPPKNLPKGKYTQTKKKTQQASGTQANTTTPAKTTTSTTPTTPTTPAKTTTSTTSVAPTKEQSGATGPGRTEGKKLTKGKYTKETKKPQ